MRQAIVDKTVLVTGANRGLGRALVDEVLRRGATRVYAASRQALTVPDERVTGLTLDVTDRAQIQETVDRVDALDILINNAGVSVADDLSDRSAFERHLAVNLYGPLDVTRAFLPLLARQPWSCRQCRIAGCGGGGAGAPGLFGFEGSRLFGHPVVARPAGRPGCECSRRSARSDRYRHGACSRYPQGVARARGAGHSGRLRAGRGGCLSRPDVAIVGRRLASWSGEGAGTPERRDGAAPAERGVSGVEPAMKTPTTAHKTATRQEWRAAGPCYWSGKRNTPGWATS